MPAALPQPIKWVVSAVVTAVALFGILTLGSGRKLEVADRVISVVDTDTEMNAAIARARATLPVFWASYDAPKRTETEHSLKVRFRTADNDEHIWMSDVKKLPSGEYAAVSRTRLRICRESGSETSPRSRMPKSRTGCSCATARSSAVKPSSRCSNPCRKRTPMRSGRGWSSRRASRRLPHPASAGKRRAWPRNPKNPRN